MVNDNNNDHNNNDNNYKNRPFKANGPHMVKAGSRFVLAKYMKYTWR